MHCWFKKHRSPAINRITMYMKLLLKTPSKKILQVTHTPPQFLGSPFIHPSVIEQARAKDTTSDRQTDLPHSKSGQISTERDHSPLVFGSKELQMSMVVGERCMHGYSVYTRSCMGGSNSVRTRGLHQCSDVRMLS